MRKIRKVIIIFCLLIIYVYFCNIYYFPNSFIIKENSKLEFSLCPFVKCESVIQTDSSDNNSYKLKLSLAGITIKESSVEIVEDIKLVPVGKVVGLKLYSEGIIVVGSSEIEDENGNMVKSVDENDIEEGDRILKVNGVSVENIQALKNEINKNINNIELEIETLTGNLKMINVKAIKTAENEYKIGLWVKDAATGVGTMTFYNKNTGDFGALGHGIIDKDTESLIEINSGEITTAKVLNINKAVSGNPGEIRGGIGDTVLGEINDNTRFGVFGIIETDNDLKELKEYEIALRNEITIGDAVMLCSLDGKEVKEYKIKINDIYLNNNKNNKSFEIEIVDDELIKNTGGIIRGLSRESYITK